MLRYEHEGETNSPFKDRRLSYVISRVELQNILHDSKYTRVSEMKTIKRFGESSQHTSYHLIIMRQALNLRGEATSEDDFVTFLQHNS